MWGCEAVAVRHDGRANPNQLMMTPETQGSIAGLREALVAAHRERFGASADADLLVGLQLTHSGRFSRPDVLRSSCAADGQRPSDSGSSLPHRSPAARRRRSRTVDRGLRAGGETRARGRVTPSSTSNTATATSVTSCWAPGRVLGRFGGPVENRTRFMREIIEGIHAEVPGLMIVVRLSVFDTVPYAGADRTEQVSPTPATRAASDSACSAPTAWTPRSTDARASDSNADRARRVRAICVTAGTPCYNPHVQRPALFPPVDGYTDPPEDPLRGRCAPDRRDGAAQGGFPRVVVRRVCVRLPSGVGCPTSARMPSAAACTDFVGLGRIALSYPELPADVLQGTPLAPQIHLPDVQRLHDRAANGPRIRVLSAGSALRRHTRSPTHPCRAHGEGGGGAQI
mgnify:CR=1 FL=1